MRIHNENQHEHVKLPSWLILLGPDRGASGCAGPREWSRPSGRLHPSGFDRWRILIVSNSGRVAERAPAFLVFPLKAGVGGRRVWRRAVPAARALDFSPSRSLFSSYQNPCARALMPGA